jgi:hypothetical protein
MAAYANFVSKLVERYDGDGSDDMPGLTVPIKHWELMNEPEFQTDIVYFQGTPAEYAEVLEATYNAVKQADPEAYIVQGGMAGMMDECGRREISGHHEHAFHRPRRTPEYSGVPAVTGEERPPGQAHLGDRGAVPAGTPDGELHQ